MELVDSDYLYRENVLLDGSFYCKDDGIAAVRDGRICEYIQKSGNVLTAEPVGMLWSRRALPPGYFWPVYGLTEVHKLWFMSF